jgi:hypothetical protein
MSTPLEPQNIQGSPGSVTGPTSNLVHQDTGAHQVSIGADVSGIPNRLSDSSRTLGGGGDHVAQSFNSDTDQGRADNINAVSRSTCWDLELPVSQSLVMGGSVVSHCSVTSLVSGQPLWLAHNFLSLAFKTW